jgi:hypothetical protein
LAAGAAFEGGGAAAGAAGPGGCVCSRQVTWACLCCSMLCASG